MKQPFIPTLLLCICVSPVFSAAPAKVNLQHCQVLDVPGGGRCGTYKVFEDRSANAGRMIGLNILVLPAMRAPAAPDPVFWLEGGPGGAATQAAGPVSQNYLRGLRKR